MVCRSQLQASRLPTSTMGAAEASGLLNRHGMTLERRATPQPQSNLIALVFSGP